MLYDVRRNILAVTDTLKNPVLVLKQQCAPKGEENEEFYDFDYVKFEILAVTDTLKSPLQRKCAPKDAETKIVFFFL